MRTIALGLVLSGGLLAGCATNGKPVPAPQPPTAQQVAEMRETYKKTAPNVRVGVVSAVVADEQMAMVADFPTDKLRAGEIISFVDANDQAVAHGEIVQVLENKVAVRFQPAVRAPVVGDAAVKF
jgi:hypothetical protein